MESTQVVAIDTSSNEEKQEIAKLASEQVELEGQIERIEEQLEAVKGKLSRVRDDLLPQAMLDAGMTEFKLTSGWKIEVKDHYQCGQLDDQPPKDEKDEEKKRPLAERLEALEWLETNKASPIVRRIVSVSLGADAVDLAEEIISLIRHHPKGNQLLIDHRRTVPWNTLSAYVKGQLTTHHDVPLDLLGVTVRRSSKIIAPEDQKTPKHPFKRGRR